MLSNRLFDKSVQRGKSIIGDLEFPPRVLMHVSCTLMLINIFLDCYLFHIINAY